MIYKLQFRENQEIVQVWHAVGAFKTVGFSRTGKKGGPFIDSIGHRNYSKAYVSSNNDILYYAEALELKNIRLFQQVFHVRMSCSMNLIKHALNKV